MDDMKDKELHKILLKMKARVRKFGKLMSECWSRDREDNISNKGWLSNHEIALFEEDMRNLIDESIKIERKETHGRS